MDQGSNLSRRYELDWLRVFAILILLLFHTGRIFDMKEWHIKNNELSDNFIYWMPFLQSWRMPLLLFISGAGSYFALGKLTALQFFFQRFKRLVIPFLFALVVIIPPQPYYEHITAFANYWDFYKSVLDFIPIYEGRIHLYHIWFIAYLFVYTLMAFPVLLFLRSPTSDVFKDGILRYFYNPVLLLLIPPACILITQLILLPEYVGRAFFVYYLCFFLLGIIFYSNRRHTERIGKNRKYLLAGAVLVLIPYVVNYITDDTIYISDTLTLASILERGVVFVGWFWVITLIAFGQHYLNRPHPWLATMTEGIYALFILHQTAIVVIGYYICKLPWGITTKFWTINILTLSFCVAFYLLGILPFNTMRLVFGMKPKPR
ncbi:acyltransferase family protein [Chryseolinea sp. H1M3-3]|uniref:acyltransferase family protein n=1 Tax=Chryseolinea sp. H1M3-3 TaxID=3034144 RepID=UPI0023EC0A32|nr:acyltransferase family protein [Chryseolinea sp. H1M3-3]